MSHRPSRPLMRILALAGALSAMFLFTPLDAVAQQPSSDAATYTVHAGDTWQTIAVRTDRSVQELLDANPEAAARPNRALIAGEKIQIPAREPSKGYWYQVRRGEYWALIASRTGVPIQELINYNPAHVRRGYILHIGEWIWIPRPAPPGSAACPGKLEAYGDAIPSQLNAGADVARLRDWLTACQVMTQDRGTVREMGFAGVTGLLVVLTNARGDPDVPPESDHLLIYHKEAAGWALKFRTLGISGLSLLETGDVNADGKPDVAWATRDCGAHTCDFAVGIVSWDGNAYRNWVDGNARMYGAQIRFEEASARGSGKELVMYGGVIASAGAGPQRARTEVWESPGGMPYTRTLTVHDAAECLYHVILEANAAFREGGREGLASAIAFYRLALDNPTFRACGSEPTIELADLRAFARFRLALAYAYLGDLNGMVAAVEEAERVQPGHAYTKAARAFMEAYRPKSDIAAGCAVVKKMADDAPPAFLLLGRAFGYANPTFNATDVCPVLSSP